MRVDSHHHLWRYDPVEYDWIGPQQTELQHDFLPEDLLPLLRANQIDAAIAVQARQSLDETRWLLDLAARHSSIAGVVGWVPLTDPNVAATLEPLAAQAALKGVRHILQNEPNHAYMLRDDFNRGITRLREHGLVYDILIFGRHLPNAAVFVDRHPNQMFVLDHIAKPRIAAAEFDRAWARDLRELARRPHVVCKLSGVVTEVRDPEWSTALVAPYLETALEAFGPNRLLFGTDWPVCLLQCTYATWVDLVTSFISVLSTDEQEAIMGNTAARVYRLPPRTADV
jgi:L-fucono-1,5-lactonase